MSRSRKTSQKYSNAAMIAYQRRQIHHGQQRAGMIKETEPFKQGGLQFQADSWLFWLFFLGMVQSGFASPNRQKPTESALRDRINSRTMMADTLTAAQRRNNECSTVVDSIVQTAAINDAFAERLEATLKQADFRIICGNQQSTTETDSVATFFSWSNRILIQLGNVDASTLVHEWIHAYLHSLHTPDTPCDLASDKTKAHTALPFYPFNSQNVNDFNRYMNRGDKLVKELYQLQLKEKAGKTRLTNDEQYKLSRARAQLAKSITHTATTTYPKSDQLLNHLKESGWPNQDNIQIQIMGHVVQVSEVELTDNSITLTTFIPDPIESIHFNLCFFETLCKSNQFQTEEIKVAERVAYSMQHLDKAGMQYLYKDATEFMEKHAKKCRPQDETSFRVEL